MTAAGIVSPSFANLHRRLLPGVAAGLLLATAGRAAAEPGDELCQAKCPDVAQPKGWPVEGKPTQCVDYTTFRAGERVRSGDAWTWGEFQSCSTAQKDTHCVTDTPSLGTILVRPKNPDKSGDVGHVAVVECIAGDWVKVSEANNPYGSVYNGHNCVNVKAAQELGRPYEFLHPNGKTIAVVGDERCEDPLSIKNAFVHPDASDVTRGSVQIDFVAPSCSRAKYTLHRDVYTFVNGQKAKIDKLARTVPIGDVLSTYYDEFGHSDVDGDGILDAVPACSQFVYQLEREMVDPPINGPKHKFSDLRTGVNLEPPKNFTAQVLPKNWGSALLQWSTACPSYVGPTATKYKITYDRGVGQPAPLGPLAGNLIKVPLPGGPDRELPLDQKLLAASTYRFDIFTHNDGDLSAIPATYYLTTNDKTNAPAPLPLPQQPTLSMKTCGAGTITATWPKSRDGVSYDIKLTPPAKQGPEQVFTAIAGLSQDLPATVDGTYKVQLRTSAGGQASGWTDPAEITRDCVAEPPIGAPLLNDVCTGVKVAWDVHPDASTANLKRFEVLRAEQGGQPQVIGVAGPGERSFSDPWADPGKTFTYHVRAVYQTPDGKVVLSPIAPASGPVKPESLPRPPTLSMVEVKGDRAKLTFTDLAVNETHFLVKRWTDNEYGALQTYPIDRKAGAGGEVTWEEPGALVAGKSYRYRVYAMKGACTASPDSSSLPVDARSLLAPTSLTAKVDPQGKGTRLQWTDQNKQPGTDVIYRQPLDQQIWQKVGEGAVVSGTTYAWIDTAKLEAQYLVKRVYSGDRTTSESALSLPATFIAQAPALCSGAAAMPIPELTLVTNVEDPQRSKLTFKYDGGPSFVTRVEYATSSASGPWIAMLETDAKVGPLEVDVGAFMNKQIWLRLVGRDKITNCTSKPSASRVVYPLPAPLPLPTTAGDKTCAQGFMIKWSDTSTYGNKFEVQWRSSEEEAWQPMAKDDFFRIGTTKQVNQCDTPVPPFTGRSYRVRSTYQAKNQAGQMELLSASRWSSPSAPLQMGGSELMMSNGAMEVVSNVGAQPGGRIMGWGPMGAWAFHHAQQGWPGYERPNNEALGERFGYYAAASETVGQILAFKFEAGKTYVFKGWINGGGDGTGKVPFQIGIVTDPSDLASFKVLSTKVFTAGQDWQQVAGVSFTVPAGDAAIGKQIAVRLGSGAYGGMSDIWFDDLFLGVSGK